MHFFISALLVIVLDQITKYIVVNNMTLGESIPIINNVFHLTYILNPGAAFGMFADNRLFFIGIAIIVIMVVLWAYKEIMQSGWFIRYGAAFFLGGAIGNLIDRTRQGLVIDFFDFRIWPIFNVADIFICVGVGMIIWNMVTTELLQQQG